MTEKSARYLVHGYSLIIKDVAAEDAGDYMILLAIKQSSVFKNLTTTLIVNGKLAVPLLSSSSGQGKSSGNIGKSKVNSTTSEKINF